MDEQEAKLQAGRIAQYRKLETEMTDINAALAVLDTPFGHHQVSAFTGNTRESRRILGMRINFSATLGTEPPVELSLPSLNVSASEVGRLLREMLASRLKAIREAMAKL